MNFQTNARTSSVRQPPLLHDAFVTSTVGRPRVAVVVASQAPIKSANTETAVNRLLIELFLVDLTPCASTARPGEAAAIPKSI
jgi:hypothetical protein